MLCYAETEGEARIIAMLSTALKAVESDRAVEIQFSVNGDSDGGACTIEMNALEKADWKSLGQPANVAEKVCADRSACQHMIRAQISACVFGM